MSISRLSIRGIFIYITRNFILLAQRLRNTERRLGTHRAKTARALFIEGYNDKLEIEFIACMGILHTSPETYYPFDDN